jgi:hypothetical protein
MIGIEELRPLFDRQKVLGAVRGPLIRQADGKLQSLAAGQWLIVWAEVMSIMPLVSEEGRMV